MELYKLQEDKLIQAPTLLQIGNILYNPVDEATLRVNGWKELVLAPCVEPEWYEKSICNYTEDETTIKENWSVAYRDDVKQAYLERAAIERDRALENDFIWPYSSKDVVKLNESNQKDYLGAYTLIATMPTAMLPFTYTLKDNVKYIVTSVNEAATFTALAFRFVNDTLEIYRNCVDKAKNLTDEELYNELKSLTNEA